MTASGTLRVLKPGLLTTVQDLGRWGHQLDGVVEETPDGRLQDHATSGFRAEPPLR